MMTTDTPRESDHPIEPLFLRRWSPRAFTGEPMPETVLMSMLEAARWAPSSYNSQPWRFLYARRDTEHWARFLDLLVPSNRSWAERASALVILVSDPLMTPPGSDKPVPSWSHSLDAGAASACLALQATAMGWSVHGMVGFDRGRTYVELKVPAGHRVEAAYAIGRLGDPSILPEKLRGRESPSGRRPLSELAFEGGFADGAG